MFTKPFDAVTAWTIVVAIAVPVTVTNDTSNGLTTIEESIRQIQGTGIAATVEYRERVQRE
jgi:hypothetical protein